MKKRSLSAISFYILSIIFLLYGAFMIFEVYGLIGVYEASTEPMEFKQVLQYYVSNCSSYFVYALLFYALANIMDTINKKEECISLDEEEISTEELDFKRMIPRKYPKNRI